MARRQKYVSIPTPSEGTNRDAGKMFFLQEKSAMETEQWAERALLAMASGGVDIPSEVLRMGAGAVVAAGFRSLMHVSWHDAKPLLDEMMECVSFVPDPANKNVQRGVDPEDIDEVSTLLKLRTEVIELHTGFSIADFLSKLGKSAVTSPTPDLQDT